MERTNGRIGEGILSQNASSVLIRKSYLKQIFFPLHEHKICNMHCFLDYYLGFIMSSCNRYLSIEKQQILGK